MSISVNDVTKTFGEQKALDNVSFEVNKGEIVAFLGPNGAGKTTMMKIITGFIPASAGTVLINGTEVTTENKDIRRKIGYLPENNPLYPEMFVREYLGFVASLYKMQGNNKKQVDYIIGITGLADEQKKKIGSLSKGYRQRVGLAQALIHDPEILILDEATSGLDPNQIVEIRNLIKEAGREKTILFSTHIMQEAEAICDRIIIINKGVIMADEQKSAIFSVIKRKKQIVTIEFDREIKNDYLRNLPYVIAVNETGKNSWLVEGSGDEDLRPALFSFAVKNNLTVLSLKNEESSLEEVFRQLTTG